MWLTLVGANQKSRLRVPTWRLAVAEERWDDFVEDILVNHYDSAYATAVWGGGANEQTTTPS